MQTVQLGTSDLQTTRLIYGCMRLPGTWNPAEIDDQRRREAFAALDAAIAAGYNHFDHADIYCHGECERLFGEWLRNQGNLRDRLIITSKVGIRFGQDPQPDDPHRWDFSAEWIRQSCEGSLRRLGVDRLDLYLLHRPDRLMNPDEIAAVFDELRAAGKVRYFGVSNFTTSQTALLQSRLAFPLVNNQLELHPLEPAPFTDGTLDHLLQHRITPTSWSPLAGGRLGDDAPTPDERTRTLLAALDREAADLGIPRANLILAWLLRHPSGILPVIGSRTPARITALAAAEEVTVSRSAWYRIHIASLGRTLP